MTANAAIRAKPAKASTKTKASIVSRLLVREKGATIDELMKATGWQAHSCRAFLTGLRKKGSTIIREDRGEGKTAYRMGQPDGVQATDLVDTTPAATT